jgi:Flp pilus assembly protein TadD
MSRVSLGVILVLAFLFQPSPGRAQQAGDAIVVIVPKANIQLGSKVVDVAYRGAIMVVRRVQGDWYSVSHGTPGWIYKDDILALGPALDFFSGIIRDNPKDVAAYFVRGNIRCEQGEYAKAIADYNKAIELDAQDGPAYNGRGYAYRHLGEPDKALADFNKALQLDTKDSWAHNNRGILFFEKGEYDKAIADYDQALRLNPKHTWSYQNRGNAWAAKGDLAKAIADYNEAVRLDPRDANIYSNRGLAYQDQAAYAEALADFEHAVKLEPGRAAAQNHLGWLLATCPDAKYRDGKKALAAASRACELTAFKSPAMLNTLAAACAETEDLDAAVRWQARAVELAPKNLQADYRKRLDLYRSGKPYRMKAK